MGRLFVATILCFLGFWLGGRDDIIGQWQWSSTGDAFSFTGWAPLEPANGLLGNCLWMWPSHDWKWDDTDCLATNTFICESRLPEAIVG